MRWKAKIDDASGCISLQRLVSTFSRLCRSRTAKIKLTPDKIFLIHTADAIDGPGVQIWNEISQASLFKVFKIESQHANNEILLVINMEQFSRALKSTITASNATFRLSKRDGTAYLSLVIGMKTITGAVRPVTQEVPITILSSDDVDSTKPPDLPAPEINLYLPHLRILKPVLERFKSLSEVMVVKANNSGDMNLKLQTTVVTVETFFKHLENAVWKDGQAPSNTTSSPTDPKAFIEARILVKSFFQFIAAHQTDPGSILMSISRDNAVVLICAQPDANLTYYIPVRDDEQA